MLLNAIRGFQATEADGVWHLLRGMNQARTPAERAHLFDPEGDAGEESSSRPDRGRRLDQALDHLRGRLGFGRVLRGPSLPLKTTHPLSKDGFRLRTPSLNQ